MTTQLICLNRRAVKSMSEFELNEIINSCRERNRSSQARLYNLFYNYAMTVARRYVGATLPLQWTCSGSSRRTCRQCNGCTHTNGAGRSAYGNTWNRCGNNGSGRRCQTPTTAVAVCDDYPIIFCSSNRTRWRVGTWYCPWNICKRTTHCISTLPLICDCAAATACRNAQSDCAVHTFTDVLRLCRYCKSW